MLPIAEYLFPSLGLGSFWPKFLEIHCQSPFPSPSGIPIMYRLANFILSCRSLTLLSLFFIWLFVCCPDWVISIFLSSRSLICSALFFLLFTAFSPALVSANEFYSFLWFLFIVSSSFLEYFAFLLIAFNSFNILIFFLKLLSIRLKRPDSLLLC